VGVSRGAVRVSGSDGGELAEILADVSRLREQLERCVASNDRLRHTLLRKSAGAALSASAEDVSDGTDTSVPQQRDGRLLQCLYEYVVD